MYGTCPNCGYCPHCGRGGWTRPYPTFAPPYFTWTTTAGEPSKNQNTTVNNEQLFEFLKNFSDPKVGK